MLMSGGLSRVSFKCWSTLGAERDSSCQQMAVDTQVDVASRVEPLGEYRYVQFNPTFKFARCRRNIARESDVPKLAGRSGVNIPASGGPGRD
jgi:hypothetical protein